MEAFERVSFTGNWLIVKETKCIVKEGEMCLFLENFLYIIRGFGVEYWWERIFFCKPGYFI